MFKSSLAITAVSLAGSALGFLVQALLARQFGAGVAVDAYLFATGVPTFLAGLINATFAYGLVPKVAGFEGSLQERRHFISGVLLAVLALSVGVVAIGQWCTHLQLLMLPAASPIKAAIDLQPMLAVGWVLGGTQVMWGCLTALLNGSHRYFSAAFLGLLPYAGMIGAFAAVPSAASALALPKGLALGTVAASLVALYLLRKQLSAIPVAALPWRRLLELLSAAPYTIMATSCFAAYVVVDSYWAPQAGAGSLSNLGYAQRLLIAIGNLAVIGPYTLVGPRLATLLAARDMVAFKRVAWRTLGAVLVTAALLATVLAMAAQGIITILFARGAFGAAEVDALAATLRHMMPGMVGMLVTAVLMKALFVLPDAGPWAAAVGLSWPVMYFLLCGLWIEQGTLGMANAYSASWCMVAALGAWTLYTRMKS